MEILVLVLILIVADIAAGITSAIKDNNYSSEKMREGLYHKIGTLLLLGLAFLLQYTSGQVPGLPAELGAIYPGTGIYIIIMETTSLLENIVKLNPELAGNKIMSIFSGKIGKAEEDKEE